jgi:hypothetical protein
VTEVANIIVVKFSILPKRRRSEIILEAEKLFSWFENSDCIFKAENGLQKVWSFIITGKPISDVHRSLNVRVESGIGQEGMIDDVYEPED